jgi:hypothetical protein
MSLPSFASSSPPPDDTDRSRRTLLVFDLAAFISFSLAFVYYTNFYQPQWLTNAAVLRWESSNTRPLISLYVLVVFFLTTRLSLINLMRPRISPSSIISTESQMYVNTHWLLKIILFAAFSYIFFASVFLPLFNGGFGSEHVKSGLDFHMQFTLGPLSQHLDHGRILYLETPTQYAPGIEYLLGALSEIFPLTLADAYRMQLLLNLVTVIAFGGFMIALTGPLFGSVIILLALTPFSIIENYSYPGWGFLFRWMFIPVFSIVLGRILTSDAKFPRQSVKLAVLGMASAWPGHCSRSWAR